ncbi:contractile injection system protein, VgrG/Pvc8 family [Paenibacillus wulumuqiensis]|uniref:contractile injection system protein, VgrG/Pvc8 family n=1 Tax=Paenibacillus wulumuqiensis TaxID=1567107 RepID=UPI00069870A6|nr:contractile injection system protein, VgrG/Pvc8 family [Paenibacillus wulumuqiensis]
MTLLFKGIGYESLRLDGPIHPQHFNELTITRKLNEHGYMMVTGVLPEEQGASMIHHELEGQPVVLRQLDTEGHSVQRLFHGIITRFTVHCIRSVYTFELEAISQSGQMDVERKRRSFQHTKQTYAELVTALVREYTYGDAIDTIANATPLGGLVLQYDETDWQFLKRLASRFGSVLVPEITAASPKVFFGVPEGKSYALGEDTFYRIRKTFGQIRSADGDVEDYSANVSTSSNNKHMSGYISYFIDSLQYYALGDHLTLPASAGSTELVVVQAHTVLRDGLLETSYELQHPQQIRFYSYDNEQMIGITLTGTVEEVAADFVRVKLDIDEAYHRKHPRAAVNQELSWFPVSTPYAAEQHTGWYDMPEKGEQVELHIPNSLESNAHVLGSLRQQPASVSDPDTKIWSHPAGSQVQMDGQELRLSTSGHMTISLQPESGIEISSPGHIGIQGGSVQLNASQTLSLEAGEAIRLKGGQSSMIVDGDTDLHAPTIHEVGTVKAPVVVADLALVPEPPLMTIEAYKAGQAAAQQQKAKAQAVAAPPKAKITPPAEQKKASGLLGLLSKVTAAIPMKTTSKVLMGINSPLARVAGVMMQVNATVPARRSGGGGSGGGKSSLLASVASSVWQGIVRQYEHDQEQRTHYDHWILGKVFTSARNLITSSSPLDFVKTLWNESLSLTNAYQQVPDKIRKQWNKEYTERELKRLGEMDIKDLTLAEVLQLNPGGWKFFDKEAEGYYITQNYYTLWMYGSNAYKRLDNAMYGSGYFLPKLEEMRKQGKDLSQLTVAEMDEMSQSEAIKLERISLATTLALDFTGSRSISSGFSEHLPIGKGTGKSKPLLEPSFGNKSGKLSYTHDADDHLVIGKALVQRGKGIKGVKGAHNRDSFMEILKNDAEKHGYKLEDYIVDVIPLPNAKGVYEVKYRIAAQEIDRSISVKPNEPPVMKVVPGVFTDIKNPKTIYDPHIISDEAMKKMAKEALEQGTQNGSLLKGTYKSDEYPEGLNFTGHLDKEGNITSYYPSSK